MRQRKIEKQQEQHSALQVARLAGQTTDRSRVQHHHRRVIRHPEPVTAKAVVYNHVFLNTYYCSR